MKYIVVVTWDYGEQYSIEFQLNSKWANIEVDLANLLVDQI